MKLYYSAGSCSTSCHLVLEESGLKYEAIEVDFDNPSDPNLALVEKMNPLGTLPILITDEGKQLDQNLAIQTFVADKAVGKNLLPPVGTFERAEAMNMLSFVAADLHKAVGGMFGLAAYETNKPVQAEVRKNLFAKASEVLKYLDMKVSKNDFIAGKDFSPADAYAFVVTGWTKYLDISLTQYPHIEKYIGRLAARPAFAKVMQVEGLN
jgi:glutathione S-transferase